MSDLEPRVPITCASLGCARELYVDSRKHADNLRGIWRCTEHRSAAA